MKSLRPMFRTCLLLFLTLTWLGASVLIAAPEFSFLPVPGSPLVTIRVVFHTGSIDDPKGLEGLAWLTSGVVARGGTQTLDRSQVLKKFFPMASDIRGFSGRETMGFEGTVHRDQLEAFYALFAEMILRPRFDDADFQRERDDAVNYLKNGLRSTEDESLGKEVLDSLLHQGHPYEYFGLIDGVKAIRQEDVKQFYASACSAFPVSVGLGGGYSPEFAEQVKQDFSPLGSGQVRPPLPARPVVKGVHVTLVQKPCEATAISIGFPVEYTRADPDFFALMVANSFLGEHRMFIGGLQKTMRMARGMNYGNYSYLEYFVQGDGRFAQTGIPRRQQFFSIWIRPVKPEQAHFAIRAAVRELQKLVHLGMTEKEVTEYKKFVLANTRLWAQTVERRLGYLMDSRFYGRTDFLKEIQDRVSTLKAAEVNAAIRRHWQTENLQVVAVTDRAESLAAAIRENKPSPMTYEKKNTPAEILSEDREISAVHLLVGPADISIIPAVELFNRRPENR